MEFARRLERAGLLFVASIAPGVAERHIAQLEAQERAAELARAGEEAASVSDGQEEEAQDRDNGAETGNGESSAAATEAVPETAGGEAVGVAGAA